MITNWWTESMNKLYEALLTIKILKRMKHEKICIVIIVNEELVGMIYLLFNGESQWLNKIWKLYTKYIICTSSSNCILQTSVFFHLCFYFDWLQFSLIFSLFSSNVSKNSNSHAWYILLIPVCVSST